MKKIGFIGLGIMGKPMAKNLIKAGYELVVYDINEEPMEELSQLGAKKASSPKDVAEKVEVIITMLPNSPDVKEVVLGKNGVLEGAKEGQILIDMSSISPIVSKEIAKELQNKGVKMLDAPVSGGEPKAIDATLTIMVGGEKETFEEVKDILLKMGSVAVLVGDIGSGNIAKLANQIIVALNIAALSEAMVFAKKAGVDPKKVFDAIRNGLAGSAIMEAKMPTILKRNFKPGFRVELHVKDLLNAMDTGNSVEMPLPLTSFVLEILKTLKFNGRGKDDHSAIINFYENLAKVEVKED